MNAPHDCETMLDVCLFSASTMPPKARRLVLALFRAAHHRGLKSALINKYQKCRIMVIYGLGDPVRTKIAEQHARTGRPLLSFDLGYWDRDDDNRKYRVSLNGFHPRDVMRGPRPSSKRFAASGLAIESTRAKQTGPIMLIGNAPKSIAIGAQGWTAAKSKEIREAFPNRKILYRPKPERPHEDGVVRDAISKGPIDDDLRRCSLVVCRHSNVAVDACRLGVPVVCDDGAAASIYPSELVNYQDQPPLEKRTEFLHRLAYWQWSAPEAKNFWNWFFSVYPEYLTR